MTRRFRMVAGPNGSGKSTLAAWLARDYAVNFYTMLNADEIFAQIRRTGAIFAPLPIDEDSLLSYALKSEYAKEVKDCFATGAISAVSDSIRFATPESVNSYTVALVTGFLQDECITQGVCFSQETVFSHRSKIEALSKARRLGFRTYLYYVATDDYSINADRVAKRYAQGGHDVPLEKVRDRYFRSLANVLVAMKHLSRAYFFDNSGNEMCYLASYSDSGGLEVIAPRADQPRWFRTLCANGFKTAIDVLLGGPKVDGHLLVAQ